MHKANDTILPARDATRHPRWLSPRGPRVDPGWIRGAKVVFIHTVKNSCGIKSAYLYYIMNSNKNLKQI